MPIIVPEKFPAYQTLAEEGLFLMKHKRAVGQDIRPLKIIVLNLMPLKIVTETQILRLISNSLIQVEVTFIHPKTHKSKNTDKNHLNTFYKTFNDIKDEKFDGMIITGAPVEQLPFEEIDYWEELKEIFAFADNNVTSTLSICWGAQAALYYYYGIQKYSLETKKFGIFEHKIINKSYLVNGLDDLFLVPHSRHTEARKSDIEKISDLVIVSESDDAGVNIIENRNHSKVFIMGHSEYDDLTIHEEYIRDKRKGNDIQIPKNYYPNNNPEQKPLNRWRSNANLLVSNWLNYGVYQATNYDLDK